MKLQHDIERIFGRGCFTRPVYYNYPGGLRFELSEAGGAIEQFITALRKATQVCSDVFRDQQSVVVCLRAHSNVIAETSRQVVRALRDAGISIPRERSLWRAPIESDDWWDEHTPEFWINLAFAVPVDRLQALLWCALATDFPIEPNPSCMLFLFNLPQQLMVWPYDDRGMDVVGPNHALLSQLYHQHNRYLLDYDRDEMDRVFAEPAGCSL